MRVLVVGLEKSGLASIELLVRQGAEVRATDIRPLEQMPAAKAALERHGVKFEAQSAHVFEWPQLIVLSPGVPADIPGLEDKTVIGEVELAFPFLKGPIIGVTGSNGKTTTTSLIGHILAHADIPVQVGGNIGTPVTAMIDSSRPDQWNVLELSSFQLETISRFRAHIAVCLNLTQNHLDRHHTFERYAAAKAKLFQTQHADDFAVLNADDPTCTGFARLSKSSVQWFSSRRPVSPGAWLSGDQLLLEGEPLLALAEIPMRGRHNAENVMAAALCARLAGAAPTAIADAVKAFRGVEHRLEFVARIEGVEFYNDSKATSVDATLKALEAFEGGLWVILGGKDKGSDYTPLRAPLAAKAHGVFLIGSAAEKIAGHLGDCVPLVRSETLECAVRRAFSTASPGDTVLLAPACASFDQFENYEHRGRVFKQLVHALQPVK